jgi:hypothetical protein
MASHLSRPLAASKVEIKKTTTSSFHPLFAITALASSETKWNRVISIQQARVQTLGLMFTAGVKKLSFKHRRKLLGIKPYTVPFSQYTVYVYTYKSQPESVTADCRDTGHPN